MTATARVAATSRDAAGAATSTFPAQKSIHGKVWREENASIACADMSLQTCPCRRVHCDASGAFLHSDRHSSHSSHCCRISRKTTNMHFSLALVHPRSVLHDAESCGRAALHRQPHIIYKPPPLTVRQRTHTPTDVSKCLAINPYPQVAATKPPFTTQFGGA